MQPYKHRWITPELELFQATARRFVETECAPNEERWGRQQHVDREIWNRAGELGLLCPSIPEEYGGGGGTVAHDAILAMEQNRAVSPGMTTNVHSGIVAHYILRYGSEAQKKRWLPKMATGEMVGAIAMSEPGAGSDLKNLRTKALKDGGHYVIDGQKTFISNGSLADLVVLAAKTDPEGGSKGVSLIVLETKGLEGFRRGRILEKLGQKSQDTSELFFENVRVPRENLLGETEGRGFYQLMEELARERMLAACGPMAAMERAVELTVEYTRQRKVFDRPLFEMQNTRFKLAECETVVRVTGAFIDDCMEKAIDRRLDAATAAMAKWWSTDQACRVVDECLQLHGGYGYMLEYPIARMYANLRVGRIYAGSNEIMKELVARSL
jgi:acyl-CoA dehydrogenase